MLVQLNKCVIACGSDLQRRHNGDGCLSSSILFNYERSRGTLTFGCCLRCSVVCVWGAVIFVLSVMRIVGGVLLWLVCVFRRVDDVCLCLWCTQLLF